MNPTGKAPSVPQEPRKPGVERWGSPCPDCAAKAQPGEVLGLYTREGLKTHRFTTHGEVDT